MAILNGLSSQRITLGILVPWNPSDLHPTVCQHVQCDGRGIEEPYIRGQDLLPEKLADNRTVSLKPYITAPKTAEQE